MKSDGRFLSSSTNSPSSCCIPRDNSVTLIAVSDVFSAEVYEGHKKPSWCLFLLGLLMIVAGLALLQTESIDAAILIVIGIIVCLPAASVVVRNCLSGGTVTVSFYESHRAGMGPFSWTNNLSPAVVDFTFGQEVSQASVENFALGVLEHGRVARNGSTQPVWRQPNSSFRGFASKDLGYELDASGV